MAQLAAAPRFYEHDANGAPLSGGKVYTYANNTTNNLTTYTDAAGGTPNANPVILDSSGRAAIWLKTDALYTFVVKDSSGSTIYTVNDIAAPSSAASLSASNGSSLVGFIQSGTGAVARTVQSKLRESVNILDFGFTGATNEDIYDSITKAIASGASVIDIPAGTYTLGTALVITREVTIRGAGSAGANYQYAGYGTNITYSGAGVAITAYSDNVTYSDKSAMNFYDFMITGTSAGLGGIKLGVGASSYWYLHSEVKNVCVTGFSNGYGFRFSGVISSYFENLQTQGNKYGMLVASGDVNTSMTAMRCRNYQSVLYGLYITSGSMINSSFIGLINESSEEEGMYIDSANSDTIDFYNYYSENNGHTHATWLAPVYLKSAFAVNFFGGYILDSNGNAAIVMDTLRRAGIYSLRTKYGPASGTFVATANTELVDIRSWDIDDPVGKIFGVANVSSNSYGRVRYNGVSLPDSRIYTNAGTPAAVVPNTMVSGTKYIIFRPNFVGAFKLTAWLVNGGAPYVATATVVFDGTKLLLGPDYAHGANCTLTQEQSDTMIAYTQSSGSDAIDTVRYQWHHMGILG